MTLQDRLLDLLDGAALKSYVLYQVLEEPHEAVDAALKGLRQAGKVTLVQGRFERPGQARRALRASPQMQKPKRRHRASSLLTSREMTIAMVAREGGTAKVMAAKLGITPHTLKGHLSSIYAKLGVRGKGELAGVEELARIATEAPTC